MWPFKPKPPAVAEKSFVSDIPSTAPVNWWQLGMSYDQVSQNTTATACINIISQEIASTAFRHRALSADGSASVLQQSALNHVLNRPNSYQSRSDFWLFMIQSLLTTGNAYAVKEFDGRGGIRALHPLPPKGVEPMTYDTEVFYNLGNFGQELFDPEKVVPASEVLHIRINCNRHPLIGESPVTSYSRAAQTANAIQASTAHFFTNKSTPGGVLSTPQNLTKQNVETVMASWKRMSAGVNSGETPVLPFDLKWTPLTMSAVDAELIATHRMSSAEIARIFRVPPYMLGELEHSSFANAEAMARTFYSSCMRFYFEHIESAIAASFDLPMSEDVYADIDLSMHRTQLVDRIEAWTKASQGGVMTPDEARERMQLAPKAGGAELYMQRQMVPLSAIGELIKAEAEAAKQPEPEPEPEEMQADEIKMLIRSYAANVKH